MSSSVFKELPSENEDKVDSNLVIVVNKDGSVSVDQSILHDFLVNKDTQNTSVSIVRVTSPTPSITDEIEQDELAQKMKEEEAKLKQENENDEPEDDDSGESNADLEKDDAPHVSLRVENFFPPAEARKFAAELISMAGIDNPLNVKTYEYARYLVQNDHCYTPLTSPSQKHSRKPAPATPEASPSKSELKTSPSTATSANRVRPNPARVTKELFSEYSSTANKSVEKDDSSDVVSIHDETDSDDDSYSSGNVSSENDRDSDLDFNIYDRPSTRAKKPSRRGRRRKAAAGNIERHKKRQSTSSNIEREIESMFADDVAGSGGAAGEASGSGKKSRKPTQVRKSRVGVDGKEKVIKSGSSKKVKDKIKSPNTSVLAAATATPNSSVYVDPFKDNLFKHTAASEQPPQQLLKSQTESVQLKKHQPELIMIPRMQQQQQQGPPPPQIIEKQMPPLAQIKPVIIQPKKPRAPALHAEALFSDMTSLFSTPDIIKKVGEKVSPTTSAHNPHSSTSTLLLSPTLHIKPPVTNVTTGFMALNPSNIKNHKNTQLPSQISIHTHSSSSGSNNVELAPEQEKQLDLIDSIVKQELAQSAAGLSSQLNEDDIPNIVKMLENNSVDNINNSAAIMGNVVMHQQHQQIPVTNTNAYNVIPTSAAVNNANKLNDSSSGNSATIQSIEYNLDALNNTDDGLTEDLLKHVAVLAENKNLQEIIDKQVLGVQQTSNVLPQQQQQQHQSSSLVGAVLENHRIATATITSPALKQHTATAPIHTLSPITHKIVTTKDLNMSGRKEPIQIVRADGRVITLPPIEAPTTRAKRRAQAQPNEERTKTVSESSNASSSFSKEDIKMSKKIAASSRNTSLDSKEGKNSRRSSVSVSSTPPTVIVVPGASTVPPHDSDDNMDSDESWNSEDDPDRLWCICNQPHNNRFMICCDSCEEWFHGKCVNITKSMGHQMENSGIEWTCPNCIQKKTMGFTTQIPLTDTKIQTTITSFAIKARRDSATLLSCIVCKKTARLQSIYCSDDCIRKHAQNALGTVKAAAVAAASKAASKTSVTPTATVTSALTPAKQMLAKKSVDTPSKNVAKEKKEVLSVLRNKNRVIVYEPKTHRCLAGNDAPTMLNLKEWLKANPTFEVVQPDSVQAQSIIQKQLQLKQLGKAMAAEANKSPEPSKKIQTQLTIGQQQKIVIVNPQKPQQATATVTGSQQAKHVVGKVVPKTPQPVLKQTTITASLISKPSTPTVKPPSAPAASKEPKPATTTRKSLDSTHQRKQSIERQTSTGSVTVRDVASPEPIRINVKKTFKEQLNIRMSEVTDGPKLSTEEIEEFANATELEMFRLFNKDTGTKYKAKYRSLMFNIKDRKNATLFQKICDKSIEPKRLVRMNPDELASNELAQWRENETKHQLEMIKKSELDMLASAKSYVMKTHKGEEVIEGKETDRLDIDPTIAVEDVVSLLNNATVSSTSDTFLSTPVLGTKQRLDKFEKMAQEFESKMASTLSTSLATSASDNTSATAVTKKKDSRRSRSRSRDRHENTRSSKSSKHKKHKSRDHRSRSHDKSRSRERTTRRSHSRDNKETKHRDSRKDGSKMEHRSSDKTKKEKDISKPTAKLKQDSSQQQKIVKPVKDANKAKSSNVPAAPDNYSLVDKILEASSSTVQLDEIKAKEKLQKSQATTTNTAGVPEQIKKSISIESDQEPSSTVIIPTPPDTLFDSESNEQQDDLIDITQDVLWSGSINMIDVSKFQIVLHSISGDCDGIKNDLPGLLDIVGRISPDTVWDYITKIKKGPNKEILLLRFACETEEENPLYVSLYQYLHSRKRLGVIKTSSPFIKDFYVLPLAEQSALPSVLLPIAGPGFVEGDANKPDLLIGIIVKIKGKRSAAPAAESVSAKLRKLSAKPSIIKSQGVSSLDERFTPPNSPKEVIKAKGSASRLTHNLPKSQPSSIVSSKDDDEPYSPGGSDDDLLEPNILSAHKTPSTANSSLDQDELQRKMDELNRQIEAQKMELAEIYTNTTDLDEPYSPSRPVTPPNSKLSTLANIVIPSNLQDILASIKNNPTAAAATAAVLAAKENEETSSGASTSQQKTVPEYLKTVDDDEEYNPVSSGATVYSAMYEPGKSTGGGGYGAKTSKLATLTEAELLSMVPDDAAIDMPPLQQTAIRSQHDGDPDNGDKVDDGEELEKKRIKLDDIEPPPPGLEDEYAPI